jgi:2'-hydroxyisoflavone reductase
MSSRITRREFVARTSALAAAGVLPLDRLAALGAPPRALSLLILGGTGFIGPHLVKLAVSRGHTVSIFTRGRREAELPSGVERLVGDRNGQLDALKNRRWDAVVDDSATNPDWVKQSAALLRDATNRYLFTSSTGVYYPYLTTGLTEADAVHVDAVDAKDPSESFGTRKAQCEAEVQRVFGARGTVVRPSYIVGPGDYTDRFTYWPVRLRTGGDVLAPGHQSDRVQFIDVRDLAAFMLHLLETNGSGIYNVAAPREPMTIAQFLSQAMQAVGSRGTLRWVDDYDFLAKYEIDGMVPWILTRGKDLGHTSISSARAFGAGLRSRPVQETVRDTLAWFDTLPAERRASAKWVLSEAKEKEMLQAWQTRRD